MNVMVRNVRLIDGTGAGPFPRVTVEVRNGLIRSVGEGSSGARNHVAGEDINGEGLTLIPGMIDCHEHFTGDGGPDNMDYLLSDTREVFVSRAVDNARRALRCGVTSARDVGARHGINILLAQQTASGAVPGPRIIAAGEWLQFPGTWPEGLTRLTETPEDLLLAVQEQIEKGAGLVKIGVSRFPQGGEQPGSMGPEGIGIAVRAAHEAGLKIAAHSLGFQSARDAVEAGIDSVDHGYYVDDGTLRLMAEKGTYLVPTMSTWDSRVRLEKDLELSRGQLEITLERKESALDTFRRALRAGVNIAAGTDAGGSTARHGFMAREIELMVEAGMTPKAALQSATRVAANLLGIQDQAGTIEVGKQADMVLVDGDPHSNPAFLRNVWAVFQSGHRVA